MKALALLMLTGSVLASNLPPNHGKTRPPKAKTQFNLSYYDLPKIDTTEIRGKVLVSFSVDEDGRVIQPEIIDTFNMKLNEAIIDKVMAIEFEPAKQNGRPVRVKYQLPILFK